MRRLDLKIRPVGIASRLLNETIERTELHARAISERPTIDGLVL